MAEQLEIQNNEFDKWFDQASTSNEENTRVADHYNHLLHRVFIQTEQGRELLKIWTDAIISTSVVRPHSTQMEVGIAEGYNQFTRNIINKCNAVEAETKT